MPSQYSKLLAPGLQDILEGILFQVLPKLARYRRLLVIGGILVITLAMVMVSRASFAWQIVVSDLSD
jgi:hypothetical protein